MLFYNIKGSILGDIKVQGKRIKIYLRITKSVLVISFAIYNKLSFNKNRHCEALKTPWQSRK